MSDRRQQRYCGLSRVEVLRKLKREAVRFRTFGNWQSTAVEPEVLAKAGFFYFNDGDKVQCAFCLGIIGQWDGKDDVCREHRKHFPTCPFMLGLSVGNVAIEELNARQGVGAILMDEGNRGLDVAGRRGDVGVASEFDGEFIFYFFNFCLK